MASVGVSVEHVANRDCDVFAVLRGVVVDLGLKDADRVHNHGSKEIRSFDSVLNANYLLVVLVLFGGEFLASGSLLNVVLGSRALRQTEPE